MSNEIMTPKSYLTVYDESAWATMPGSPTYYHIPVEEYEVAMDPETRQSRPFTGLYQAKHSSNHRGYPHGKMTVPMYGWQPPATAFSLAEYITDWAFESWELTDLPSKGAEWAEGPDVANVRHHGLRVDTATLRGDTESNTLMMELDLMGKSEENFATAQTLPADRNKLVEMEFCDCTFTINSVSLQARAFALQIRHGIDVHYLMSSQPSLLVKTTRDVNFTIVPVKNSDTYAAYRRLFSMTEFEGVLTISGLHNGTGATGTRTIGTFTMPRMSFVNSRDQNGKGQLKFEQLALKILKPDTSSNDLAIVWSEA